MLITVLMFLFQTSFHSYFLTNLILKSEILQIDSNLVQGYIATCFMFVYMFMHIYIYIYIYLHLEALPNSLYCAPYTPLYNSPRTQCV